MRGAGKELWLVIIKPRRTKMSVMKELQIEAVEEFHKWEEGKYGDKTPLVELLHVDMWVEAYMLGYANGVKSQYLPSNKAASCGEVL